MIPACASVRLRERERIIFITHRIKQWAIRDDILPSSPRWERRTQKCSQMVLKNGQWKWTRQGTSIKHPRWHACHKNRTQPNFLSMLSMSIEIAAYVHVCMHVKSSMMIHCLLCVIKIILPLSLLSMCMSIYLRIHTALMFATVIWPSSTFIHILRLHGCQELGIYSIQIMCVHTNRYFWCQVKCTHDWRVH